MSKTHLIKRYGFTVACGTKVGAYTKATRTLADVTCIGCKRTLFMADREAAEAEERAARGRQKN